MWSTPAFLPQAGAPRLSPINPEHRSAPPSLRTCHGHPPSIWSTPAFPLQSRTPGAARRRADSVDSASTDSHGLGVTGLGGLERTRCQQTRMDLASADSASADSHGLGVSGLGLSGLAWTWRQQTRRQRPADSHGLGVSGLGGLERTLRQWTRRTRVDSASADSHGLGVGGLARTRTDSMDSSGLSVSGLGVGGLGVGGLAWTRRTRCGRTWRLITTILRELIRRSQISQI